MIAPLALLTRQAAKVARIGTLGPGAASSSASSLAVAKALQNLGCIDGRKVTFELRNADRRTDKLADMAAERVRMDVDVLVAVANTAGVTAQKATRRAMSSNDDPEVSATNFGAGAIRGVGVTCRRQNARRCPRPG